MEATKERKQRRKETPWTMLRSDSTGWATCRVSRIQTPQADWYPSFSACFKLDWPIYCSYSAWGSQFHKMPNSSLPFWKSATFFVESRDFLSLISRWMGQMLLQFVAHIFLNYGRGKQNGNQKLDQKLKRTGVKHGNICVRFFLMRRKKGIVGCVLGSTHVVRDPSI